MSINRAMQSGITALAANSAALATISNNIANSNTTGFKRVMNYYTDLVSGSSTKATYGGNGVAVTTQQTLTDRGELNSTSSGYNLGINGQGFFVTSANSNPITAGAPTLFTRDGTFSPDPQGFLANAAGLYLQGWPADANGNIATSSVDITKLAPINVSNIANPPTATTAATFAANLDSTTPISTAITTSTYNPATAAGAMSTYDATTNTGTKPDSTVAMNISDSLGQPHDVTLSLLKKGVDTTTGSPTFGETVWDYEVSSPDITDTAGLHQIAKGTLAFKSDGTLDTTTSTTNGGAFNTTFAIGGSSSGTSPSWNASIGAAGQSFSLGLSGAAPTSTLTQLKGDSTTTAMSANGTEFGTLTKVEIGDDGIVTAIYNNGDARKVAQVALATFVNANGLTPVSGNAFEVSTDSGTYSLKTPGAGGAGDLEPSSLESSTVDLAQEFTGLITTQRAYSAASKIITTADQMLQELLSIKQ